jgi:hypothetical protein
MAQPHMTSPEDKVTLANIVTQARALYPSHPMLLLLEIDSQPQDPEALDQSMKAVDAGIVQLNELGMHCLFVPVSVSDRR